MFVINLNFAALPNFKKQINRKSSNFPAVKRDETQLIIFCIPDLET